MAGASAGLGGRPPWNPPVAQPGASHGDWPAVLVLEDGTTFHGTGFGARGEAFGEMVFNTGMTVYHETLTDPSY